MLIYQVQLHPHWLREWGINSSGGDWGWAQETSQEARRQPWAYAASLGKSLFLCGEAGRSQRTRSAPNILSSFHNFTCPAGQQRWPWPLSSSVSLFVPLHFPLTLINQEEKPVPKKDSISPILYISYPQSMLRALLRIKTVITKLISFVPGALFKTCFPAKQGQWISNLPTLGGVVLIPF